MSIKVKLRGNGKAIVRFNHHIDEQYFIDIIRMHRDDKKMHPKILLKDQHGTNIPPMPPPEMPPVVKPGNIEIKKP